MRKSMKKFLALALIAVAVSSSVSATSWFGTQAYEAGIKAANEQVSKTDQSTQEGKDAVKALDAKIKAYRKVLADKGTFLKLNDSWDANAYYSRYATYAAVATATVAAVYKKFGSKIANAFCSSCKKAKAA